MMRVAVLGAAGRMGTTVCAAVSGATDLELVAAVDPSVAGLQVGDIVPGLTGDAGDVVIAASVSGIAAAAPDIVVDFTRADVAVPALEWCADHGVHAVSGTTGIAPDDLARLGSRFEAPDAPNCVIAANFAISAVLLMRLAEIAAVHLDGVEIIELHHDAKRDAPSGTAVETARRIAAARTGAGLGDRPEPTAHVVLESARGAVAPGGIHVHSVRLPGLVAHEEVIFGGLGQSLTIRQDSYDRTSFVPGILAALRRVPGLAGMTVGLDAVLGL